MVGRYMIYTLHLGMQTKTFKLLGDSMHDGGYDLYFAQKHATQDRQPSKYWYAGWGGMIRTLPTSMQCNTSNLLSTSMHDGKVWFILCPQACNSILPIF